MKENYGIEVKNVSKVFRKNLRSFRSMAGFLLKQDSPDNFYALNDISFTLKPGDTLGIVGKNGSGKSTLLKVLANITKATSGSVKVKGKIASLIELGAGFHQELTGRENIYLYGSILGMSKKEITENFDKIVEFAELREWLDTPIKFYSSGMFVRLGFAIVAYSNPDILLIDEAIAVGDEQFQQKCLNKIDEFKKEKKIIVLVSHTHDVISMHTDKAILLNHGKVTAEGMSEKVVEKYIYQTIIDEEKKINNNTTENKIAEVIGIKFFDEKKQEKEVFETGELLNIKIECEFKERTIDPIFGIIISNKLNNNIYALNTLHKKIKTGSIKKGKVNINFYIKNYLSSGIYNVSPAIATTNQNNIDWKGNMQSFGIINRKFSSNAIADFDTKITIN
ncbi:MAG: ABC transporter ATP-binding protein [bacterium]